jgi:hypothetical protein
MKRILPLCLAALVLTAVAYLRAPEYDEAYSMFLTAGDARPAWPTGIFTPAAVRGLYAGHAGFGQIAHDLRVGDVHPPLYFWTLELWRRLCGPAWFTARLLSVLASLAALAALGALAARAGIPEARAILLALCSYGFAYDGIVARGFALAQLLNIIGVALLFVAGMPSRRRAAPTRHSGFLGLLGGLSLGAAGFTNYLAVFTGLATLLWLAFANRRSVLPALCGFALFLPADLWFFIAQRSSRQAQFVPFSIAHALSLLARDSGAALFGGLPLYAGSAGPLITLFLLALLLAACGFVARRRPPHLALFGLAAIATPLGLLALGVLFHNTPIEIRYLGFSLPYLALLFAAALPRTLLILLLAIESCAIIGLAFAPATMQPQAMAAMSAAAAMTPGTLVLLPYGNDGVGIPGPFIATAPDDLPLVLVRPGAPPPLRPARRLILVRIAADAASRATTASLAATLTQTPCWRTETRGPVLLIATATCPAH